MPRYIIFLFLLFGYLGAVPAANEVNIDTKKVKITDFKMSYYIDTTEKMLFDKIKEQKFTDSSNKITLGKKVNTTWAKVIISNHTDENKKIFIHNPSAYGAKTVEFYEVQNDKLIRSNQIDLNTEEGALKMHGANALFGINLDSNKTKTIYMKYNTFSYQYFALLIYDEDNSKKAMINDRIDIALLVGILLALALYNMVIYFSSGYKENLYYSLFLTAASAWISLLYGLTASLFHIYGAQAYQLHLFAMTLAIFLVLFFMNLFDTKENYKTEHKFLASVALLNLADFIFGIFNIFKAMELFSILTLYTLVVFLWASISIYRKGNVLAKLFLIGHSFFALFSTIGVVFFLGEADFNYITRHATGIGYAIEALMLAYIIAYKIKLLENKKEDLLMTLEYKVKERTKELQLEKDIAEEKVKAQVNEVLQAQEQMLQSSRMAQMGEMISMIAHQWRQPLGAISMVTIGLNTKIQMGIYDLTTQKGVEACQKKILDSSGKINQLVEGLSNTIDDFRNFYKPNKDSKFLSIGIPISKALQIIEASLLYDNIKIVQELKSDKSIEMYDSELMQVILSILQNSQDNFREKNIKDAYIIIGSKDTENGVEIKFIDNGGGIDKNIIKHIFNPYFSTKSEKTGTGLGLSMSTTIISNHHKGSISATNTEDGVCFTLTLKEQIEKK